jgi:small-conductance mechanosensitive channel
MQLIPSTWPPSLWSATLLAGAVIAALILHAVLFAALGRVSRRTGSVADDSFVRHARGPVRLALPLFALYLAVPALPLRASTGGSLAHLVILGVIAALAWLVVSLTEVVVDVIAASHRVDVKDNLAARRIRTQMYLLRRITVVVVVIVAGSVMLMTFPSIRHLGVSLFASAGVAGLVVGLAARSTISNLISGVQVALTEPIRIDDVVIVEGEWGWIEEIGTTYVVVRIWDLRRLIVPLSYFIEKPFQNWTRTSADLLGTVFVYADYTVPVDEVREELHGILEATPLWDRKVWNLQVTDATEHTLELRALMSAADSSTAWDLRCHVREQLVAFLQRKYPEALPQVRASLDREARTGPSGEGPRAPAARP